jgi:LmbE family N-acetylglucosaminyl deacetylase
MKNILVLAAHTDDEVGCSGTLSKYIRSNRAIVNYLAFSFGDDDTLRGECESALSVLGINGDYKILSYPVRHLQSYRQEILDEMISWKDELKPDIVFVPSTFDIHQDHKTVCEESIRAFKHCSILGYEFPWNNLSFSTHLFFDIDDFDLKIKIDSFSQYKSQEQRYYANELSIESLARVRGMQINSKYAEAFEVIRMIER